MTKALVAMSGGVDSSAAALLLKQQGFELIGATMKLFSHTELGIPDGDGSSERDVLDARIVAERLGIEHRVFDFSDCFRNEVIDKFIESYENGQTPNPCLGCNRHLKFGALLGEARSLGCEYIATGHYARIEKSPEGRFLLKKAVDLSKDQSYMLYTLSQEQLAHTLLPLGGLTKEAIRTVALENGLVTAHKSDSQDICFIKGESYADFIERYTGRHYPDGDFVDENGRIIGRHNGIIRYTVGQRKGLGLALPEPRYVGSVRPEDNTVHLVPSEGLFSRTLTARDINLIAVDTISAPMRLKAKVRYRQSEQWATVLRTDTDELRVEFDEPQRAITKGQAVVLYDGDTVVGGGVIS